MLEKCHTTDHGAISSVGRASRLHRETNVKNAAVSSSPDRSEGEPMVNLQEQTGQVVATPIIYHGTPLTPRSALIDVCTGRAMCVSFYRPDDVEAVEAISPAIMFRQRRILHVESSTAARRGMGRKMGLVGLLRLAGAATIPAGSVGCHTRHAWCAFPAQRRDAASVAVRAEGFAPLAHGRADRAAIAALREIRPRVLGLDGCRQTSGSPRVSRPNGTSQPCLGQSVACAAHDARDSGGLRLSFRQRRRDNTGTERVAI